MSINIKEEADTVALRFIMDHTRIAIDSDAYRALVSAIVSLVERVQGEWLPIEDAPKDGTEILLIDDDGIRVVGRWGKHNHVPIYGWIRPIELYGEEVDGFDPVGWRPLPPKETV